MEKKLSLTFNAQFISPMSLISLLRLNMVCLGGTFEIYLSAKLLITWLAEALLARMDLAARELRVSYVLEGMINFMHDLSLIWGVIAFALKR